MKVQANGGTEPAYASSATAPIVGEEAPEIEPSAEVSAGVSTFGTLVSEAWEEVMDEDPPAFVPAGCDPSEVGVQASDEEPDLAGEALAKAAAPDWTEALWVRNWDWPEIEELAAGSSVPFPVDALPPEMAAAVNEVADAVLVDPAIPGQAALGVLAGMLGHRTEVVIKETWRVSGNLYVATVCGSADGKSPGSSPFWAPLVALEGEMAREADDLRRQAEVMLPILESQLRSVQKGAASAAEAPMAELLALQEAIEGARRALTRTARASADDVTPERLADLMADNGGALTAINDEGAIFSHLLGMYSKNPNMSLFLKGWEGSRVQIDRKGGSGGASASATALTLERPLLTVVAAVQPTVVAKMGATAGLEERGVLGRILWAWPRSMAGTRLMDGHEPPPLLATPAWNGHLVQQVLADPARRTVVFHPAATALFDAWHDQIERGLAPGGTYAAMQTFAPKIRESTARIAGLFARVDGAATVTATHMSRALRLGDYYLAHTAAMVESWAGGDVAVALRILTALRSGRIKLEGGPGGRAGGFPAFTVRDAYNPLRLRADEAIRGLQVLEAHNYVRPAVAEFGFGEPGRAIAKESPRALANPAIWAPKAEADA